MANSGLKAKVNLLTSLDVDTVEGDVWQFGDQEAPSNQNTGIERNGGIVNLREKESLNAVAGSYFQTEDGDLLGAVVSGENRVISANGKAIGLVSRYGVQRRTAFTGLDDAALTADGTLITLKISGNQVIVTEQSLAGVQLNTRTITFANLASTISLYTSINFVRYQNMHYANSQEFALRLGEQIVILKESTPGQTIVASLGSSTVLGQGNAIRCAVIWNSMLIVAGDNGRMGSFDGTKWKNYDGTGSGIGPSNSGTVTGNNAILAISLFGNGFAVGGIGGRLGSFDGSQWKNYDGTGTGTGPANNATLIGSNDIKAMANWTRYLVVGGVGGRIGCTDGTFYQVYTQTIDIYPTSNSAVLGANDVLAMAIYTNANGPVLVVAGAGGRLGSWDGGGWRYYDGTLVPALGATTWTAQSVAAITGLVNGLAYGVGIFVGVQSAGAGAFIVTSGDGVNWTARAVPFAGWNGVIFTGSLFIAFGSNHATSRDCLMTSSDGITWTMQTPDPTATSQVVGIVSGAGILVAATIDPNIVLTSTDGLIWTKRTGAALTTAPAAITFGASLFVIVGSGVGAANCVMTSPDGITWTIRTAQAALGGWRFITFGAGVFVCGANPTASATQAIMTSPDGITWTYRAAATSGNGWSAGIFTAGLFVIVGVGNSSNNISTSPDGITWTLKTTPASTSGYLSIAYNNGEFVVGGGPSGTNHIITAGASNRSGINNNSTALGTNAINAILADTSLIVIAGVGGRIASFNGTVWNNYNSGAGFANNATAVGVNDVLSIAKFGTTYVFGSVLGRLASWDGVNWKNYDGTGTGTGVFNNSTVVGLNDITALAVLGSLLHIMSAGGVDNPMTSAGLFASMYVLGSGLLANLLTGQSVLGSLYAYRYENGQYLLNLTGNNLNIAYILNNSTLAVVLLNCRYAWPQISGGFTRHIITETPRFTATDVLAVSLVGYVDFTSPGYTTVQQYQANGVVVSSILSTTSVRQIGFAYADFLFKKTASATDIYAYLAPRPQQSPTTLQYLLQQTNSETNVNGYGKLNNLYGVAPALPIEFRVLWTNGEQATLSVASVDGLASDCLGTLLTNPGEFDPFYTPHLVGDSTILYQFQGTFIVVNLGATLTDVFQKEGARLYKLNTISPLNLYDALTQQLYLGSVDYHGQMLLNSSAVPAVGAKAVANVILDAFSNSIDVGDKLVYMTTVTAANIQVFGIRLPSQQTLVPSYGADTYIADVYSFSTLSSGLQLVIPGRVGLLYIPTTLLPVAIGGLFGAATVSYPVSTLILSDNYEGYQAAGQLFGSFQAFQLFAQQYVFDGEWIYLAEVTPSSFVTPMGPVSIRNLGNLVRVAPADGLVLIATAPTMVYFLSSFDNSLYQFDGGRTLGKGKRLTAMETVINGVFNVHDNTLLLQTATTLIWIRDNIATVNSKKAAQAGTLRLYDTTLGVIVGNDTGQWQYFYYPVAGTTVIPLAWKSSYLGMQENLKSMVRSFVVALKVGGTIQVTWSLKAFNEDQVYTQTEMVTIAAEDVNSLGFARIRIQPTEQRALGYQVGIATVADVMLQDVTVLFDEDTNAIPGPTLST